MCLKSHYGLHNDIYLLRVMKVIFFDVIHLPALSSEMPLDWMQFFPDWTTAETLLYLLPLRPQWEKKFPNN